MASVEPLLRCRPDSRFGQRGQGGLGHQIPSEFLGGVVEPVPDQGMAPVLGRLLHQSAATPVSGVTVEGQLVDGRVPDACRVAVSGHDGVQGCRMPQLVLTDGAEGQVLLKKWGYANPLGVLLAHQVLVVGEGQEELPDAVG